MKQINLLFLFVHLITFPSLSQGPSQQYLDMIGYEELLVLLNDFSGDQDIQKRIAYTYVSRARNQGDTIKIARGYDRLARIFDTSTNLKYADSLINYTNDWKHVTYPAAGYLLKAFEYSRLSNLQESYSNLLKANEYSEVNENITQRIYILDTSQHKLH